MDEYSIIELADMYHTHRNADCKGRETLRLHEEHFLNRPAPHHTKFAPLYRERESYYPARSPDLSRPDFFCRVHIKSLTHEIPVESVADRGIRTSVALGRSETCQESFRILESSCGADEMLLSSNCG
ncbi:hypothetical protein NPIL_692441 [Nephila pilipes]|uniref:Uncharacterized protein n=1 Tax=Nephila pilipes TaxID=299642 RepID=A0A8X6P573_NEPPI|nr:hypothetical protein NPIL_307501 [Nephila pilipes]GFT52033.1 hypothetical protein NPIL_692441 [Nephila pilipes]